MKHKIIIILALLMLILNSPLQAGKWNVGGGLSSITNGDDDALLNSQLESSGLNATASTEKNIRILWQVYAGYEFTKKWGVELGYLDLGKVETSFTGTTADIDTFLNLAQDIHPQTAQGWLTSVNIYIPIDHDTRFKLRTGVYSWAVDYTLQGVNASKTVSQSGTDISYGVGIVFGRCYKKGQYGHINYDQHTVNKKDFGVVGFGFSYCF